MQVQPQPSVLLTTVIRVAHTCCCQPEKPLPEAKSRSSTRLAVTSCPPASPVRWVRSDQHMNGYLNQATTETITADGWLRTGDIGHLDSDNYLYVDDRLRT